MYTFCGFQICKKLKFFGASPQTPLKSLQHSSLAGGRGLLAARTPPKPHSLLSAIRVSSFNHFGARPCEP